MTDTYRALGFAFTIDGSEASSLAELLAPLRSVSGEAGIRLTVDRPEKVWNVLLDGSEKASYRSLPRALTGAIWQMTQKAIESRPDSLLLHAAAVVLDDRLVIVSGRSGAGKSTTAAALLDAGARYLTDEVLVVDSKGRVVEWLPRPLGLDVTSIELLGGTSNRRAGPVERPVRPGDCWSGPLPDPCTIVLLDEIGGPLEVTRPDRSAVVARLIGETFPEADTAQWGLDRIEMLTRDRRAVQIKGGTPTERIRAIRTP
mgnify:CR=1 FL=1